MSVPLQESAKNWAFTVVNCSVFIIFSLLLPLSAVADDEVEESSRHKYALSVFHYNLQYVAGGLDGILDDFGSAEQWEGLDTSEEGVEDAIILESFLPMLDLYASHPEWGADLEMQGLMTCFQAYSQVTTNMQVAVGVEIY